MSAALRRTVLISALCLALACVVGCASSPRAGVVGSDALASGVGDSVSLSGSVSVVLASVGSTVPAGVQQPHRDDALWMTFVVSNSSDTSVVVPSRPRRPAVFNAAHSALDIGFTRVTLQRGAGGFGPASTRLGEPRIGPGGSMQVQCEVRRAMRADRPLTVEYAPLDRAKVRFIVP